MDRLYSRQYMEQAIAIVKLLFTLVPVIKTMVTCNHAWCTSPRYIIPSRENQTYYKFLRQFETIAAMKLALSLTSGFIAIFPSLWWLLLYLPGTISLASSNFSSRMSTITAVFGGVGLAISIATVIIFWLFLSGSGRNPFGTGALIGLSGYASFVPICLGFGALYSDWELAIAANNLMGYPSGASKSVQALWVLCMIGKRLNLLTI